MSIIYNALQKTQKNLMNRREVSQDKRWLDIALLVIIFCLLVIIFFAYFPKIKKMTVKPAVVIPQKTIPMDSLTSSIKTIQNQPAKTISSAVNELDYQGKLILNGVFLSQQEKVAMINNQPMHIGDVVEGKKIISIELNKIKLLDNNNILVLRTVS